MADFATRLRELRTTRGLRQIDVAKAIGVAQTTIANYESRARFPDEAALGRFADFFNIDMDFLLGRSASARARDTARSSAAPVTASPVAEIAREYLALLRGNAPWRAGKLVENAIRDGYSMSRIYLEILEPALKETGRLWEQGALGVGEEHLISMETQRIMSRVSAQLAREAAPGGPRCLVLCGAGEEHVIGAAMVSDLLRTGGWEVMFPGANLGVRHVLEMTDVFEPTLVALSVTMPAHASAVGDLISTLRSRTGAAAPRIMVGGQAFRSYPALWKEIEADATAADAAAAVDVADRLAVGRAQGDSP